MTSQGTTHGRFTRAIKMRNVRNADDAARELGQLSLEDALQLVYLYGEKGERKYEKAALKWLGRFLEEAEPSLETVAAMSARLVERLTEPELSQV